MAAQTDKPMHKPERCAGHHCPFHNPSNHHMADWPKNIRYDKSGLTERICPHGIGHPDPDSAAAFVQYSREEYIDTHGCDGCCRPPAGGSA